MDTVVIFKIDEQVMALPVNRVERVIWAVEITGLPGQAEHMLGVIDVEGETMNVINLRNILGLNKRELDLDDHIVIIEEDNNFAAFIVDKVEGVIHFAPEDFSELQRSSSESYSSGLLKKDGTLIVVLSTAALLIAARTKQLTVDQRALATA